MVHHLGLQANLDVRFFVNRRILSNDNDTLNMYNLMCDSYTKEDEYG